MQDIKKIILVGIWYPGSAVTNRLVAYAKEYASTGKEVLFMCRAINNSQPVNLGSNIRILLYQGRCGYFKLWGRFDVYRKIVKTIKNEYINGETVIHVYGLPIWGFMLPKERYNIFYERTEAPYYRAGGGIVYKIQEAIHLYMVKYAKGLLVISESLKSEFLKRGVKNIEIINMFVDSGRFEGILATHETKYIAYCGVLTVHKDGVDDLIKAFSIFHKKYPEYKLMLIGGNHVKEIIMQLHCIVDSLNISENVIFTGEVPPDRIPFLLKNASILALARPNNRQAQYGFPTKLGEYLATGNPVVVTRVGELDHFLQDRVNCVFAKPDNPQDFSEQLLWVKEHPMEVRKMTEKAKFLIENDFSAKKQSVKALAFMQKVINM